MTSVQSAVPIAELCVKPQEWEYEREIRIIRNLADCKEDSEVGKKYPVYLMDIPLDCIKSITLGERTPVVQQIEIYESIKETNISMFFSRCGELELSIQR